MEAISFDCATLRTAHSIKSGATSLGAYGPPKGLIPFALASKANCWFLPKDKIDGNKAYFRDQVGKRRFKALVGFSPKRGVYWHFAGELRPLPNHPETLVLKPHVIFSEDGITPLESAARMHALRRGFCKSWWNDRWRDLLVAYLSFLSDENAEFALDAGGVDIMVSGSSLSLNARSRLMKARRFRLRRNWRRMKMTMILKLTTMSLDFPFGLRCQVSNHD
jgi:hypothetical protein